MVQQRLLTPVIVAGPLATDCWLFASCLDGKGYGAIHLGGKQTTAHRVAASLCYGFDLNDSSIWVLHHCDTRACYRPSHLYLGDRFDNARDRMERGNRRPTHILSVEDVREIRSLLGVETQDVIAARYGVQQAAISKIATGRSWKDVA